MRQSLKRAGRGFIDCALHPERARELAETPQFEELADALIRLNAATHPCGQRNATSGRRMILTPMRWTHRTWRACLLWPVILTCCRATVLWLAPENAVQWCKKLCARLRCLPLRSSRADLVVRGLAGNTDGYEVGVTAYLRPAAGPRRKRNRGWRPPWLSLQMR